MRRYFYILMMAWILPLAVLVGINFLIDPYRIFHSPWLRDHYYTNDTGMRVEAAGIINTEDFKSIILGTSMAANFSALEASHVFDSKYVNISLWGAPMKERAYVLEHALQKKKIDEVIYSLDLFSFFNPPSSGIQLEPYVYLYDSNIINDIWIYTGKLSPLKYAFCLNIIFSGDRMCPNHKNKIEDQVEWHTDQEHSKRFGGLENWLQSKNDIQIKDALKEISKSIDIINAGNISATDLNQVKITNYENQKIFNENLLDYAIKFPSTQFYLFFPPYSRLKFSILKQGEPIKFDEYLGILRMVVNDSAMHSNIHLFGFETEDFLDDIANYKDTMHYHQRFNSKMLHWMKNGDHKLTPENIEKYILEITNRAGSYDLRDVGAKIDAYLAKK